MYARTLSGLLAALVILMGGASDLHADERLDHVEMPSPSGGHFAIMDGYRQDGLLAASGGFYDVLTIKQGDLSVTVGKLPAGAQPAWLSDTRLIVTLGQMWIPSLPSSVLGVEIVVHLGDRLHVESVRKELEGYEKYDYTSPADGPESARACKLEHRNWEEARLFWAWARGATDNGDPDPGPWVSKYYPQDCSALRQP